MKEKDSELFDINIAKFYFNNIIQICEDYLKYIISYKSLTLEYVKGLENIHKIFDEKLKLNKNNIDKCKNIDFSFIFVLINSISNINYSFLENQIFCIKGMENSINSLKKFIEEKKVLVSKFLDNLNDSKHDLLIKINNLEKEKSNFFNSLSSTEKTVSDFYVNKLKIEEYSKNQNKTNNNSGELKNLFLENSNLEEQMNKSINESKILENNYKSLIFNSTLFKKTFIDSSNIAYENIKNISVEIVNELKQFIQNIIILLKNCFAIPLKEIDTNLSKLILNKEKYSKIIKNSFKSDETVKDKFIIGYKKYSLHAFNTNSNNNNINNSANKINTNNQNKNNKVFVSIEDGNEKISYIENDLLFFIALKMFSSFSLIKNEYNIDFKFEEEKRTTRKIISNILLNIEKKFKKSELKKLIKENKINNNIINDKKDSNNEKKELKYIHENDIQLLYTLLDKHYNRVIFLQTMSQFRTSGRYCMPLKVFEVVGKCLNIIIDKVLRDDDYGTAKTAVVLSQTYFMIKDDQRYYLHNSIKKHKLFQNMKFWENTLDLSIKEEITKNVNIKNKKSENKIQNQKDVNILDKSDNEGELKNELSELSKDKYSDIAFGQIASIVNSMIDFDVEINNIRSIIEPKIQLYNLNQNQKNNIELVIESKLNINDNEEMIENNINFDNKINDKDEENIENNINKLKEGLLCNTNNINVNKNI